nr:MAG TPA: hypothetical protein [Caudoviricetes sp.]
MKIDIKKTGAIFREVGKGEVFMMGSAVYMRTTAKEDEHFNAWSFTLNDIAHRSFYDGERRIYADDSQRG